MKTKKGTSTYMRTSLHKTRAAAVRFARAPKVWYKNQEKVNTAGATRRLNKEDIIAITVMAFVAVIANVVTNMMMFKRWSLLQPEDFTIYHPWSPYIYIIGSVCYVGALYNKGIKYWLAYFPAVFGLVFVIMRVLLIHEIITPGQIAVYVEWIPNWFGGM